ncbi:MAG TPA: lipopolysaccharide heptosyltransferase II [Chlamydiales bacterium]|nr:lipopolysaccharide heptosyltransferase II [Chlamydiales bacterium]
MRKGVLLPKENPQNIIVRMPNWIGDLVMATPILADLKAAYPHAKLTAMCQKPLGELLKKDPHLDEIFSFHKPGSFLRRAEKRSIVQKLRQGKYDLGVLLTNSFSSAWWFWQGRVKQRLGFARDGRSFLLTNPIHTDKKKDRHLTTIYKELLLPLGIKKSDTPPRLYVDDAEIKQAKETLGQLGITDAFVGINPGAAFGEAKCWRPERFAEVAKDLEEKGYSVVFFGDAKSKNLIDTICASLPSRVLNLAGQTSLRELMAYLKLCQVLLTNDSGPMHMAVALGTEVVALFGSTSATYTGPYDLGSVIQKPVKCAPCFKRVCPIDFRCMKQIQSDEVIEILKKRL